MGTWGDLRPGTVEFTAVEEDLADWCVDEPPSRLAAGHPQGLALTGA